MDTTPPPQLGNAVLDQLCAEANGKQVLRAILADGSILKKVFPSGMAPVTSVFPTVAPMTYGEGPCYLIPKAECSAEQLADMLVQLLARWPGSEQAVREEWSQVEVVPISLEHVLAVVRVTPASKLKADA